MRHGFRFGSVRNLFYQLQPATQKHAFRNSKNGFSTQTTKFNNSRTIRKLASASGVVSITGILFWISESRNPSSDVARYVAHETSVEKRTKNLVNNSSSEEEHNPHTAGYSYSHLSDDERTRLLVLEPGEVGDELKCALQPTRYLQGCEYEALSYA
jgi:hypothetical protein